MKPLSLLKPILAAFFVIAFSFVAKAGGQDSSGGDAYEAEFKSIGLDLAKRIRTKGLKADRIGFEVLNFDIALREVQIFGTDAVLRVDERAPERNAVNSGLHKVIVLNERIWQTLNEKQKSLLVMHEYLRFLNIDDSQYSYSTLVIDLLGTDPSLDETSTFEIIGLNRKFTGLYFVLADHKGSVRLSCDRTGLLDGNKPTLFMNFQLATDSFEARKTYSSDQQCKAVVQYIVSKMSSAHPVRLMVNYRAAITNPEDFVQIK